jgi:hypothetical protein
MIEDKKQQNEYPMLRCLMHGKEMRRAFTPPSLTYGIVKCACCHIEGEPCNCKWIQLSDGKRVSKAELYERECMVNDLGFQSQFIVQ